MTRIERGNVVLMVEDDADIVQHYLDLGYNVTDENGNILKEAVPTNLGMLQTAYVEHKKKIAELEETIAKLTAKKKTKKVE